MKARHILFTAAHHPEQAVDRQHADDGRRCPGNHPIAIVRGFALTLLLAVSACSNMENPGPQSVAGMSPDGTVSVTEIIAVGATGGIPSNFD
jgi:hypothetical protein